MGVGSAYLDGLLCSRLGQQIRRIHPRDGKTVDSNKTLALKDWPNERYRPTLPGKFGALGSVLHYRRNRRAIATNLTFEILRWCRSNDVRRLWVVLESPLCYRLAALVARQSTMEMVATIWDPAESVVRQFGLDRISQKDAIRDFGEAIAGCLRLGVISEAMAEHFRTQDPQLETTVMRLVPDKISNEAVPSWTDQQFRIAFAGSLYASREFNQLLAALDSCHWTIAGRPVRVQIMGTKIHHQTTSSACIEFLGYRSNHEVVEVVRRADCCYVPYWFDPAYGSAVKLCFPSKLITSLVARTPIFFHGPSDSSPAEFLRNYLAGVACHQTAPKDIVNDLESLAKSDRRRMAAEADRAILEEFNDENFQQRFQFLIAGEQNAGEQFPTADS